MHHMIKQSLIKIKKLSRDFRRTAHALDAVAKKTVPLEGNIHGGYTNSICLKPTYTKMITFKKQF